MKTFLPLPITLLLILASFSLMAQSNYYKGIKVGKKNSSTAVVIDSIASAGTYIKFYSGSSVLNAINNDTVSLGSIAILKADSTGNAPGNYMTRKQAKSLSVTLADSNYRKSGSYASRYDLKTEYVGRDLMKAYKGMGSTIKAAPLSGLRFSNTGAAMVDNILYASLYYIEDTTVITGCKFALGVQGDYTADNFNGIALYKVSGETYTQVAISANTANVWKAAGATTATLAFTSPYTAYPAYYYVACLYNSSAQVTAPTIYLADDVGNWWSSFALGGNNKISFSIGSSNSFPSPTISASGTSTNPYARAILLY
jgi:hypothetical protein